MHSINIAKLVSYCVLLWMSAKSANGENIDTNSNNDTKVVRQQYHQSCLFNRDCDSAKNLFCHYQQCKCIPNMIFHSLTQKCIVMKCDETFQTCPDGYKCYGSICSQFCDMFSNDCNPAVVYKYTRNMAYLTAFYLVIAFASVSVAIAIYAKMSRKHKNVERIGSQSKVMHVKTKAEGPDQGEQ